MYTYIGVSSDKKKKTTRIGTLKPKNVAGENLNKHGTGSLFA